MQPLLRHILVPVDGSEPALYVVDKIVLHQLIRFSVRGEREAESELAEPAQHYLDFVRAEAARSCASMAVQIRKGDPFEEIIAVASALLANLIVMGHTGRRGTARVLVGSVTQHVLDYAPCPVLVTRANSA